MQLNTIQDFLENEQFVRWLVERDPKDDLYWKAWLAENPTKKELFYQAIALWSELSSTPTGWSEENVIAKQRQLVDTISAYSQPRSLFTTVKYYVAAAIVILISAVGYQLWKPANQELSTTELVAQHLENVETWLVVENSQMVDMFVNLPDSSSVSLSPNSTLKYPSKFTNANRIVYLTGEAFFEVTKNAKIPFFVYTPKLATKVLGTSFHVRSFEDEPSARVTVVTGQVQVNTLQKGSSESKVINVPIIASKNEQVVLEELDGVFEKQSIEEVVFFDTEGNVTESPYRLKNVPLSEVFSLLEEFYNVDIHYNEAAFKNCTITALLEDMPLSKKLELICESIDAEYQIEHSTVQVTGSGCTNL